MQKNKKQLIWITVAASVLLIGYMTLYICHAWSPEKILKEYLARYQKKYPDITFSIKSYNSGFDGNYTIEVNDIVVTNEEKPIIQINKAVIGVSLATLLKESGDIHIELDRVYSHESSHIFLEKEIDQLINDISSQYEVTSKINYWKHEIETKKAEVVLTEIELESDNDIPGNERVGLKMDVSYRSDTKIDFRLESEFDLASLMREKELRGKHYLKLKKFKYNTYRSKTAVEQVFKIDSSLKTNGDLSAKFVLLGELLTGEFRLLINKKTLSLSNIGLDIKLSGIHPDDLVIVPDLKISGGLRIDGSWNFRELKESGESKVEVKGQNLYFDDNKDIKPINLNISVLDIIRYDFKAELGSLIIEANNKVSLDFSNHESSLKLGSINNKKINQKLWKSLLTKNYFKQQFLSQIELNNISIDDHELSGDIIWSRDSDLGEAQVVSLETKGGSLIGRRVMTKSTQDCLFELKNFPMSTLSWLGPESWSALAGNADGEIICPNRESFKIEVSSNEIKLPVFPINKPLKESAIKMRYYKDDRFSSLKAIWDRGRVEKINFKNRVYNIEGKREGILMVLSLSDKELIYKEKNNQWVFQEVRK